MRRLIIIISLLFFAAHLSATSLEKNKMPDFNYPKTVVANAEENLKSALRDGNREATIKYLVQTSLAQSMVTSDNAQQLIGRIDSIAQVQHDALTRSIIYYFEAKMLSSYYSRNSYTISERKTLADATNMDEWSKEQFESKVIELLQKSLAEKEVLINTKISDLGDIINYNENTGILYPTMYDMICWQSIDNLSSFSGSQTKKMTTRIFASLKAVHAKNYGPYINATIKELQNEDRLYIDTLKTIYNKYIQLTDMAYLAITGFSGENSVQRYSIYQDFIKRYPNSVFAPEAKNSLGELEDKHIKLTLNQAYTSADSINIEISNTNVSDLVLYIYRMPDNVKNLYQYKGKLSDLHRVAAMPVQTDGIVPFSDKKTVAFKPLAYGRYFVLCDIDPQSSKSLDKKFDGTSRRNLSGISVFTVSDIQMFSATVEENTCRVFAVNSISGKPLNSVTITDEKGMKQTTNKSGYVVFKATGKDRKYYLSLNASLGNDKFTSFGAQFNRKQSNSNNLNAKIFTDLAVYHPGDTIQLSAVCYHISSNMAVAPHEKLSITFHDQNYDVIDTISATTDDMGHISTRLIVPRNRMNGQFNIQIATANGDGVASHHITVSEYKMPTFYVKTDDSSKTVYNPKKDVVITGKASSFVGIPIANAKIVAELNAQEWSWYRFNNDKTLIHTFNAKTASDGSFSISIPCDSLNLDSEKGSGHKLFNNTQYILNIAVTSDAGETQYTEKAFRLRRFCTIQDSGNSDFTFNADDTITLPLKIQNSDEDKTECSYLLKDLNTNGIISTGSFSSDSMEISLSGIRSGKYRLIVSAPDADDFTTDIVLFHTADKIPPVESPLWIPKCNTSVDKDNNVTIQLGNSNAEAYIYCIAMSRNKVISDGWLKMKSGIHTLKYHIPNAEYEYLDLNFITFYNGKIYSKDFRFDSRCSSSIKIKPISFRDNLVPGGHERWTFQILNENGKFQQGAMLCEMYDKAIDQIKSNYWEFNPWPYYNYKLTIDCPQLNKYPSNDFYSLASSRKRCNINHIILPDISLYGVNPFYGVSPFYPTHKEMYRKLRLGRNLAAAPNDFIENAATDSGGADCYLSENVIVTKQSALSNKNLANATMRAADIKTALWRPNLHTDADGNIFIDFFAPQFNTTWNMQVLAYTSDLHTAMFSQDVITSKPIMVRANLPRFVRQGDRANLASSLMNATDSVQQCNAVIELFIPETGKVIASKVFTKTVAPRATNVISINWTVPDTVAYIGYRIKAATSEFGDGEQASLIILPSISPIIESKPFYVDAARSRYTLNVPQFPSGSRVTLEYCDNPVWYCITALPSIKTDNYLTASALAHSLYALTVADGIAKSSPDIKEAISYWNDNEADSTLVSNLEKNSELKISTLLASPWLQDAQRQTLRMRAIADLFNEEKTAAETDKIVSKLGELQMADGGWTWFKCHNSESSLSVTSEVLEIIGDLRHLGYLKDNTSINDMLKKAIAYYDKQTLDEFNKRRNKKDYSCLSNFVYIRSLFNDFPMSATMQKLHRNALLAMKTGWKGLSLPSKAYFAIALHRNNDTHTAKAIIESIRQFSVTSPDAGMYWDNLNLGWCNFFSKTALTSTMLKAFAEIEPTSADIDKIRKWLILDKQANDWGNSSLASDATYALLASGSKWLGKQSSAEISIGGKAIDTSKADQYLGYFKRTLSVESSADSVIAINRHGASPAWGALYCQYAAPMTEVKAASVRELSIEKETYVVDGNSLVKTDKMKVGDRVQVRFVIRNTRDLEYVTLNDERAACTEPVEQISGYTYLDGIGFYKEIKNDATRLFFGHLPKGTHIITYDLQITAPGEYNVGIASVQSQYAPHITAHSKGNTIKITSKQ